MRYSREDACRAWLTRGKVNYQTMSSLMEEYPAAETIYDRFMGGDRNFLKELGMSPASINLLYRYGNRQEMHTMLQGMKEQQMGIVSFHDRRYPDALRGISDPPHFLFYIGDLDCLLGKCVTIVGSRTASPQGIQAAETVASELASHGVTVISGLAYGIDSAAHRGCMQGGSPTAAVLACGLDIDYPTGNRSLREEILTSGGVLLSEYPPGTPALNHHFPVRNRIMSGLGKAVIMMECRIRSGSMLTVNHALDQGREVYAYPGIIGTEWAEGAHQLLREGATYFTSAEDILSDLGWLDDKPVSSVTKKDKVAEQLPPLTDDQRLVLTCLSKNGEMSFDQLMQQSGLSTAALSITLTMLQLTGLVKALPGKIYAKI